jgi:LPS-assembly protein
MGWRLRDEDKMKPLLMFFVLLSVLFSHAGFAQTAPPAARIQGISVQADSMVRDNENETIDLQGNVQVIYKNQHMSCDRALVNLRAQTLDARGNVLIVTEQANVGGDRVLLDYSSNTGVIFNGYVQSGRVLFEGSLINKLNESEYTTGDARYTTCTTCPEAWSFSGSRLRAEMGGYAYIKNAVMRFSGVPVIWIPYLIVPLKSDRQSGLLTPGFETSSSGGLAISESYFWALSRSQDATFTLKNYEFRGLKGQANYRYVLNDASSGELDAATMRDRVFGNDSRLNTFRDTYEKGAPINRWFIKYQHYYEMPDGYIARAQINDASDLQYPKDFPLETQNLGDSAMESRVSLTKNTLSQHYSVDASYYNNLLQSNPLAGNDDAVHRLPELKFSQTETRLGTTDFLFSMDMDYVNFARASFGYDEMAPYTPGSDSRHVQADGPDAQCSTSTWEQDANCHPLHSGVFNSSKDLIRTGQRLDIQPTLYRPIKWGHLDLLPKLSYRETEYAFPVGNDSFYARRYVRAELSARTTFSAIFGAADPRGNRIKHEIQPDITYTEIPWIYQPNHPFFGSSQQAETPSYNQQNVSDASLNGLEGLQFDYNDRVYDRKVASLGITNRLTEKKWVAGVPEYRQFLSWRVAESFDIYQSERSSTTNAQPWSDLISDLKVDLGKLQIYQLTDYYPYQHVTNNSSRVRLTNSAGDFLQLEYLLSYNITPGQTVDKKTRTEYYTWAAKKRYRFIDFIGKINYDANPNDQVGVKSWGYGTQLKMPGDCFFFNITHYHVIGGDTNFQISFNFIWDGKDVPQLSEGMLGSFGF